MRIAPRHTPALSAPIAPRGPAANSDVAPRPAQSRFITDPRPKLVRPTLAQAMQAAEAKLATWLSKASAPPSVQYAILFDGQLAHQGALGLSDLVLGTAASNTTLYSINSMSKSLTAASIMQLVERGKLGLDTKVVDIVPEFARVKGDADVVASITVRELLSHTGRLSRDGALAYWNPGKFWDRKAWPTWQEVAEQLPKAQVLANPDKHVKYSNLGYMILGEIVTRVSGMPYEQHVRENILEPLAMRDTFFDVNDAQLARCAVGYEGAVSAGKVMQRGVVPLLRTPGAMGAASGCKSTATDVARWLGFLRDPASAPGVLSAASVATMRKTAAFDETSDTQYGLGLVSLSLKPGTRAFGHTGSGMGFASVMRMTTDGSVGVIALTNDWNTQQNRAVDIIMSELVDVARPAKGPGAPPRDPAWRELMGDYRRAGTQRTVTTNDSGDLVFNTGARLTPVPGKADTFVLTGDARSGDNDETLFFKRDPQTGAVTHLLTGGTTLAECQRIDVRVP